MVSIPSSTSFCWRAITSDPELPRIRLALVVQAVTAGEVGAVGGVGLLQGLPVIGLKKYPGKHPSEREEDVPDVPPLEGEEVALAEVGKVILT
jgi:hypothetical protein